VASYNVYRGTTAGGESATAVATGLTATKYGDTSLTAGTKYYYEVAAANSTGQGLDSTEASATTLQPSITIAAATGSSTSITVTAGQTATYQLVLSSANYSGTISFSCSGAPTGDTCTVPMPVTVTSAGSTTPVSISVQTAGASASAAHTPFRWTLALAAVFLLPAFLWRRKWPAIAMGIVASAVMLAPVGGAVVEANRISPLPQ
jgi:titin